MKVFTSNLSELEGLQSIYDSNDGDIIPGTLWEIIEQIDSKCPGFKERVIKNDGIASTVAIYKNIIEKDGKLFDTSQTEEIRDLYQVFTSDDMVLVSIFEPHFIVDLIKDTLGREQPEKLHYFDKEKGQIKVKDYNLYIDPKIKSDIEEPIYEFVPGQCTLEELAIYPGEDIVLTPSSGDGNDPFDRKNCKLLPSDLIRSLTELWGLNSEKARLRLFQEDALFFLSSKLNRPELVDGECLLLSVPTGGGKTEAFLLPLISHILLQKRRLLNYGTRADERVRAVIVYPTKALANDQARRLSQILETCNQNLPPETQVSLGILTGDTPDYGGPYKLREENLFKICPNPRCGESVPKYEKLETSFGKLELQRCRACGRTFPYLRLTRQDILKAAPDILITNPDMINYCLQNPILRRIFAPGPEIAVFDEVHQCTGVFGCHVAHLLRRLEEVTEKKPVYVGLSATIRNAKEVAALLFDVPLDEVFYLHPGERDYLNKDSVSHYRRHISLRPAVWKDRFRSTLSASVRLLDLLGHAVRDPHFRKILAFCNFRQDTDDLVKSLAIQEERYFIPYQENIRERIKNEEPATEPEAALAADGVGLWYEYLHNRGNLYNKRLNCGWHRGGLEQKERVSAVNRFATCQELQAEYEDRPADPPIDVMVSTNTLELGIDIGDVTTVVNVGAPSTTNEYAQRVGRGGRRRESAAITVVNRKNPLDLYFWRHFEEYADPERREFEDAPIIITNNSIVETHLLARILDYAAVQIDDGGRDIKVSDFRSKLVVRDGEEVVKFLEQPERFGRILFNRLFIERTVESKEGIMSVLERYLKWLKKEQEILSVEPNVITPTAIEMLIVDKCIELANKMDPRRPIYNADDTLTGLGARDRSLVPRMRGAGQTVGLYLMRERGDELKDTISRRQAVSLRPPGGFATQGHNAFKIERIRDFDGDKAIEIRKLLESDSEAEAYYKQHLIDFTRADQVNYYVPGNLSVRYSPYRFYCPRSGCWRTYTFLPADGRCEDCNTELRQLTEVYVCARCGEIYEPPVPRSCINPSCVAKKPDFIRALNKSKTPQWEKFYRLQSYPDLHWRCPYCGLIFNFNNKHTIALEKSFLSMPFRDSNFDTPEGVAKHFQYRPEGRQKKVDTIINQRVNIARFSCNRCKENSGSAFGKVNVTVVPTSRSVLFDYFVDDGMLCESILDNSLAYISFRRVKALSLAKEHYRIFKDSKNNTVAVVNPIFDDDRSYLANLYGTHAVFFEFTNLLDDFIQRDPLGCRSISNCVECVHANQMEIDNWSDIMPRTELLPWEKMHYKDERGEGERAKRPDPRGRWCERARRNGCMDVEDCSNQGRCFRRDSFLKYIILHSLKHALLLAMPRYTGVDTNLMKGVLFPNGRSSPELVVVDQVEDGSGGLFLLRKNWEKVWDMTAEILELTAANEGNLLLPYGCSRYNVDLCPFIAFKFAEMVRSNG